MYKTVEDIEREVWNRYFAEALDNKGQETENKDLWWQISEDDTVDIIYEIFAQRPIEILEAGCGSGGTNFSLAERLNVARIDLLDISENALKYAQKITPPALADITHYTLGSVFEFEPVRQYDLVWNTGLIEHYDKDNIIKIVANMLKCVKKGGVAVIGMPNRKSPAILKAALLGTNFAKKYLPFIKGYRNTTEILYSDNEIKALFENNFDVDVQIKYAGSPLFVGTPKCMVRTVNKMFQKTAFSFLTYFILTERKSYEHQILS
ncbi:MAG: class I SAM-dependent methyltransferase [Alphaproteobacteria bacterium]|nr:class I SAM-dependent methyltransferase [Alphaproteobacteria bacterium]